MRPINPFRAKCQQKPTIDEKNSRLKIFQCQQFGNYHRTTNGCVAPLHLDITYYNLMFIESMDDILTNSSISIVHNYFSFFRSLILFRTLSFS
jgi:hypothetical protein